MLTTVSYSSLWWPPDLFSGTTNRQPILFVQKKYQTLMRRPPWNYLSAFMLPRGAFHFGHTMAFPLCHPKGKMSAKKEKERRGRQSKTRSSPTGNKASNLNDKNTLFVHALQKDTQKHFLMLPSIGRHNLSVPFKTVTNTVEKHICFIMWQHYGYDLFRFRHKNDMVRLRERSRFWLLLC